MAKINRIDGQLDMFCAGWRATLEPVTAPTAGADAPPAFEPPRAMFLSIAARHADGSFSVYGTRRIEVADAAAWTPDLAALRPLFPALAGARPGEPLRMYLSAVDADGRPSAAPVRRLEVVA